MTSLLILAALSALLGAAFLASAMRDAAPDTHLFWAGALLSAAAACVLLSDLAGAAP